jgi:hypothetical protein
VRTHRQPDQALGIGIRIPVIDAQTIPSLPPGERRAQQHSESGGNDIAKHWLQRGTHLVSISIGINRLTAELPLRRLDCTGSLYGIFR